MLGDLLEALKERMPKEEAAIQDVAEEIYGGPEGLAEAMDMDGPDEEGAEMDLDMEMDEDLALEDELDTIPGAKKPIEEEEEGLIL